MVVFFMRNEYAHMLLDYWEFDYWVLFASLGTLSLKFLVITTCKDFWQVMQGGVEKPMSLDQMLTFLYIKDMTSC